MARVGICSPNSPDASTSWRVSVLPSMMTITLGGTKSSGMDQAAAALSVNIDDSNAQHFVEEDACDPSIWTKIAADPIAFESPSAGFALDWRTLKGLQPSPR